jgi:hypothetical protein
VGVGKGGIGSGPPDFLSTSLAGKSVQMYQLRLDEWTKQTGLLARALSLQHCERLSAQRIERSALLPVTGHLLQRRVSEGLSIHLHTRVTVRVRRRCVSSRCDRSVQGPGEV